MADDRERPQRGGTIGGRHGSPTITVALPFAHITNVDSELRDAVVELASLVAQLAAHTAAGSSKKVALVADSAEELHRRLVSASG